MERCANFRREMIKNKANPTAKEVQWCILKGTDMQCAGWSDLCPIPKRFICVDNQSDDKQSLV